MISYQSLLRLLVVTINIPSAVVGPAAANADTYLPVVDLGYEVHKASYNVSLASSIHDMCSRTNL
jgi:hypothetical protein